MSLWDIYYLEVNRFETCGCPVYTPLMKPNRQKHVSGVDIYYTNTLYNMLKHCLTHITHKTLTLQKVIHICTIYKMAWQIWTNT